MASLLAAHPDWDPKDPQVIQLIADMAQLNMEIHANARYADSRAFGRGGTNNQARNQNAPPSRTNNASPSGYSK